MKRIARIVASLACVAVIAGASVARATVASGTRDALAPRVGVAVSLGNRICLSIRNAAVVMHSEFLLLVPPSVALAAHARVTARGAACPGMSEPAMSGYTLHLLRGTIPQHRPVIALLLGGRASLPRASIAACTSSEGVHLTMWQGRPGASTRLWHQYDFLGYDVEPTCTDPESAPDGK